MFLHGGRRWGGWVVGVVVEGGELGLIEGGRFSLNGGGG